MVRSEIEAYRDTVAPGDLRQVHSTAHEEHLGASMTSRFVEVHIELPYDRGHYWRLVVGTEKAIISERAAFVLAGKFGVPVQGEPKLAGNLSGAADFIGEDFHLSKKAARLLVAAGIKAGGQ